MRLITVIMIAFLTQVSAAAFSQRITLNLRNTSLKTALKEIRKHSGYDFYYDGKLIADQKSVNIVVADANLEEVLRNALKNTDLTFEIEGKTVSITRKTKANIFDKLLRVLNLIDVQGYVLDEQGSPLIGASVRVRDGREITNTNSDGYFYLKGIEKDAVLVISFVGYQNKEVRATAQMGRIKMELTEAKLAEVDVTANTGYQRIPKERATGSFGVIGEETLKNKITGNIVDRLEGLVSGFNVNITRADATLAQNRSNFSIRSQSTIQANAAPLIVVDNFPTDFDLSYINPDDVESITVLKDAAAASIWGARAANGVVVVVTKKGAMNSKWKVNLNTDLTLTNKPRLDYLPIMGAAEYVEFERDLMAKGKVSDPTNAPPTAATLPHSAGLTILIKQKNGLMTNAEAEAALAALSSQDYKTQYNRYLLQNPVLQQYSLSLNGGGSNSSTYLSASYANELPNATGNKTNRMTLSLSQTVKFLNRFTFMGNLQASSFGIVNNGLGLSPLTPGPTTFLPYDQIVDDNGNPVNFSRAYYYTTLDRFEKLGYQNWRYNYLDELANSDRTSKNDFYRSTVSISGDIVKGLSAKIEGTLEKQYNYNRNYYNENTYFTRNNINSTTSVNATGALVYGYPTGGILQEEQINGSNYNLRGQLDYNATFNKSTINAIAGIDMREVFAKGFNNTRYGYSDRDLTSKPVAYGTIVNAAIGTRTLLDPATNSWNQNRFMSSFFNASYTYDNRYIFSASARLDDTNLFGASQSYRITPLWSLGAAWNLKKESWINTPKWINNLKLRTTYGVNGNVDLTTSPYLISTIFQTIDVNTLQNYALITTPENPYLTWEKTKTLDVGLDFGLFNGKVSGAIDFYHKSSYDLLGAMTLNPTLGFTTAIVNTANMKGKGLDVNINVRLLRTRDWQIGTSLNYGYNTTEISKTSAQLSTANYYLLAGSAAPIVGQPVDRLFSYQYAGLDNTGQPQVFNEKGEVIKQNVAVNVKDALVYSGRTNPPHFGGWTTNFQYKKISLSTLVTYQFGHIFRRPSITDYNNYIAQKSLHRDVAVRWRTAGDEAKTAIPGLTSGGAVSNYNRFLLSDYLIESASHIRLREVVLGYDIISGNKPNQFINNLRLNIQGRNLALWTKNKQGIDPNFIPATGTLVLPPAASFALGLKAQF